MALKKRVDFYLITRWIDFVSAFETCINLDKYSEVPPGILDITLERVTKLSTDQIKFLVRYYELGYEPTVKQLVKISNSLREYNTEFDNVIRIIFPKICDSLIRLVNSGEITLISNLLILYDYLLGGYFNLDQEIIVVSKLLDRILEFDLLYLEDFYFILLSACDIIPNSCKLQEAISEYLEIILKHKFTIQNLEILLQRI